MARTSLISFALLCLFAVASVSPLEVKTGGVIAGWGSNAQGDDYRDGIEDVDNLPGLSAENETHLGWAVGLSLEFVFNQRSAIGTAVKLADRTIGVEVTDGTQTQTISDNIRAFDFPLHLKRSVFLNEQTSIHGFIGAQFTYAFGYIQVEEEIENGTSQTDTWTYEPDNRLLYGPTLGFGIGTDIGLHELQIDLLYFGSLNSAVDDYTNPVTGEVGDGPTVHNIGLSIAFMTPL